MQCRANNPAEFMQFLAAKMAPADHERVFVSVQPLLNKNMASTLH